MVEDMPKKIQAHILLKNKNVKKISVEPDSEYFQYNSGIYVVRSDLIRFNKNNQAELFYFENNPTPLNRENRDNSGDYLDSFIKNNFIEQVSESWKSETGIGTLIGKLLSNPQYIMLLIMGLAVLYSIWESGGKLM